MVHSIFLVALASVCLSLSHAQTTSPNTPTTSSAGPSQTMNPPSPPLDGPALPVSNIGTVPTTSKDGEMLGSAKAAPGKYEEYQSICRTNEYDIVAFIPDETKAKRIQLLKNKIESEKEKDKNKLRLRLLKEFIDQRKSVEANDAYAELKKQALTAAENNYADGLINYLNKKYNASQKHLEKSVIEDPKNFESLKFLAEVYKAKKNYYEAAQVYEDLNKEFNGGYYDQLCEVLVMDSHHADGEKACKKAQLEKPKNPYPTIYLGISSREKQLLPEANVYFKQSLKIKETEMALVCVAEMHYIDKKYNLAIENFKKSISHTPQSLRSLVGLAWAQLKNKNATDALLTFKTLCEKDRTLTSEIRKAYKLLTSQNSPEAKQYLEQIQACVVN